MSGCKVYKLDYQITVNTEKLRADDEDGDDGDDDDDDDGDDGDDDDDDDDGDNTYLNISIYLLQ